MNHLQAGYIYGVKITLNYSTKIETMNDVAVEAGILSSLLFILSAGLDSNPLVE
jgi:hypothetical protein